MLMIVFIFIPIFAVLIVTGYGEYRRILGAADETAWRVIDEFGEEQEAIIVQTRQFLKLLSRVPSIRNLDYEEGNRFLQEIHEYYPQYSTIVVADSKGLIDICAIPLDRTINVQDRSWFRRLNESGRFVIDQFIISRSAQKASLPFAYPIFDDSGQLEAAVGAAYDLEYYDRMFIRRDFLPDTEIYVTDRAGSILYYFRQAPDEDYADRKKEISGQGLHQITGISLPEGPEGFILAHGSQGQEMMYWYQRLSVGDASNEISLVLGISRDVLLSDVRMTTRRHFLLYLLIAMLSLVLARILGGRAIFTPIQILLEKTIRVRMGDLSVAEHGRDMPGELQNLSEAIDLMTFDLARREEEREMAQARLRVLFEQASDAIYVSDREGKLIQVNRRACEQSGYTREELLELNVFDMDEVYRTKESFLGFLRSFSFDEPVILETSHVRKDGTVFPVELTVSQLITGEGLWVMGIARDITERKRLLEEISHSEKLKSIGQLAGGIAHDFNNQLAGIFGYVDLLQMTLGEGTEERELVDQISYVAEQARRLTSQLLSFSRKGKRVNEIIDINETIGEVLLILENTIDKKISLDFVPGVMEKKVSGDPSQIHNVLLNIALNARDAMPDGGKLKFASRCEDDMVIVTVTDTGQGMSREVLGRALEPFFTTKPKGAGTGMGLSAAFGAMKAHDGDLKIESEAGKGTRVSLYFPAVAGKNLSPGEETISVKVHSGKGAVMLVDDNEAICRTGSALLSFLGYDVIGFSNPLEAKKYYEENWESVDFIIMDMIMPEMNGRELFDALVRVNRSVKVLLSSGYSQEGETQYLLDRGVKGFIQKPFNIKKLSGIIEKLL